MKNENTLDKNNRYCTITVDGTQNLAEIINTNQESFTCYIGISDIEKRKFEYDYDEHEYVGVEEFEPLTYQEFLEEIPNDIWLGHVGLEYLGKTEEFDIPGWRNYIVYSKENDEYYMYHDNGNSWCSFVRKVSKYHKEKIEKIRNGEELDSKKVMIEIGEDGLESMVNEEGIEVVVIDRINNTVRKHRDTRTKEVVSDLIKNKTNNLESALKDRIKLKEKSLLQLKIKNLELKGEQGTAKYKDLKRRISEIRSERALPF